MTKDEEKRKSYKIKLTRLLTGAVAVTMAVSLAGCALNPIDIIDIGGNDYSISEEYDYDNNDYGFDDSYIIPGYDDNQENQNTSENNGKPNKKIPISSSSTVRFKLSIFSIILFYLLLWF